MATVYNLIDERLQGRVAMATSGRLHHAPLASRINHERREEDRVRD